MKGSLQTSERQIIWNRSFPEEWDKKTRIEYLQRKIILNSIAYYMFDRSPLSDRSYDELSRQLVQMQAEYNDISETQYGYVMYDFDGTTGFDLYDKLRTEDKKYLVMIAKIGLGMKGEE